MWKYVLLWFPMLVIAVANGTLRVSTYGKRMDELRAHQLSTLTGIVLLGVFMWWAVGKWPPRSSGQAIAAGILWMSMTVAFEFLFGHYAGGHSWRRLAEDYNLLAGRVWPLVPAWVAAAPWLFYRLAGRS